MQIDFAELIGPDGEPYKGAALGAVLSGHAQVTPDAPAFSIGGRTWSFAQLDSQANRRARLLARDFGVVQGDRVVIAAPNCVEYIEVAFAIWKLGATPCPVSWRIAEKEFVDLVALMGPRCIAGTASLPHCDCPTHDLQQPLPEDLSDDPLPPAVTAPGKIMNSGGSTGRPKLIIDPEPSSWGPDKKGRRRLPRTTFLNPAPLHHSAPFAYTTGAIGEGSHAVCMERFDPEEWLRRVEQYRPDIAYVVPTMMSRISKLPEEVTTAADLRSIHTLTHMAAPCPPDVKRWWINRVGPETVLEIYGGTERIGATVIDGAEWLARPGSVGRAAAGYEIVVMDEDGHPLPPGEVGEIFFRNAQGAGAAYDYIGADTRIRDDLDSFGDMGWVDADGYLYIADRRTDMVLLGGANIFPAEIEAAIETLPGVLCAAVIGIPEADMGNRLHAIVELADNAQEPSDGLAFLAPALQHLAKLKHPRSVEFTRERIRDDTGKVRRSALRTARLPQPESN
ncbi:AMP-binding protein [Novosphingobium malaysiense]|uniref:AMP-dependent synthetase n=1 Tax=Novosphingobium malaysiense TaxID=1348853 RepID=A0A0B1ZIV9_9SPHN|nr:AMP-binding protein [Novosphingobium malaysiense]KHK89213.1 AMP-dependent synthetase [Novosphingobium malaysiense]